MPKSFIQKAVNSEPIINGAAVVASVGSALEYQDVDPEIVSIPTGQIASDFNEINYYGPQKGFGYEYTAGFVDRTTGTAGVSASGTNVQYTTDMVQAGNNKDL